MVFYTVIMGIIDLSVSHMLIGQDLRRHFEILRVCWREFSLMEE